MAYKVNIINKEKSDNKVKVAFEIKSGNKVVIKHELKVSNEGELKQKVREFLTELENSETLLNVPLGELDMTEPQPTPTPDPTPEQTKKGEFRDKLNELRTAKQYLDLGLIAQAKYDTLKEETKLLGKDAKEL